MIELDPQTEERSDIKTVFVMPGIDINYIEYEKSNKIEEFCQKIVEKEGFKDLFDSQNLKEILKDRTVNAVLDDLNLRKKFEPTRPIL